ncbi:hypothetical protein EJ04DRAFT_569991 [Polyplosphaeria fusca]|uniref:Uncharacterized protein n=1 Tax=Polyplosphaeria fusca TaxID=682080 RepID=A0A9P4QKB3_9PLEO|nr:hypothetical protein EJ04DRAFT_569991 [Polyplosphaeria fusca]
MGRDTTITADYKGVMNLAKDGKNLSLWEEALRNAAVGKAAEELLDSTAAEEPPEKPTKPTYRPLPTLATEATEAQEKTWTNDVARLQATNNALQLEHDRLMKDFREHVD